MSIAAQLGNVVAPDDNLLPGQTYTFSFSLGNYFSLPSNAAIAAELDNYAPAFVGNVRIQEISGILPWQNYYDITFTYAGDGSDVASDVAASMVAAFAQGGDSLSIASMNGGNVGMSAQADITTAAGAVGDVVGTAAGSLIGNAAKAATSNFYFDAVLIVVLLAGAAYLLFEVGGLSGLKKSLT